MRQAAQLLGSISLFPNLQPAIIVGAAFESADLQFIAAPVKNRCSFMHWHGF
jgi:hypothetical protein